MTVHDGIQHMDVSQDLCSASLACQGCCKLHCSVATQLTPKAFIVCSMIILSIKSETIRVNLSDIFVAVSELVISNW